MNSIALMDLIGILSSVAGLFIVFLKWKRVPSEPKIIALVIMVSMLFYCLILFLEWKGIGYSNEDLEDFVGAIIPIIWGYFFYVFVQQAGNADLLESRRQLEWALEGTRAGLWDWDVLTGKVSANKRLAEIMGYSLVEIEPLTMTSLTSMMHPDDLAKARDNVRKNFSGETDFFKNEIRFRHKDRSWVWIISRGMVVERDNKGQVTRMAGTHIDITNQKKIESSLQEQMEMNREVNQKYQVQNEQLRQSLEQINEINRELIKAKEKAEESDRLKSAFLSNMSHEIRTPMNGIVGFSSMLTKPDLPEAKRIYYARIIINSGNQLLAIVNDILDISKIETGMFEITEENVNINQLVNDLHSFFKPQASAKNIALTKYWEGKEEIVTRTDKVRLKQVLSNLLQNAIKFTFEGSIEFGFRRMENDLYFFVKDTGIGIPSEHFDIIFKPFRQIEHEISRVPGGTGLGLAISKKLVELMGGKIWVESEAGTGSAFYFTIPLKAGGIISYNEEKETDFMHFDGSKIVILLAEDDEVSYLYLKEILNIYGIRLIWVKNGKEAVDACKSDYSISLVLMDIKMPGLNGLEATKIIKQFRPDLPVVAVTAFAKTEDKSEALAAGCIDFLSKPLKKEDILNITVKYSRLS